MRLRKGTVTSVRGLAKPCGYLPPASSTLTFGTALRSSAAAGSVGCGQPSAAFVLQQQVKLRYTSRLKTLRDTLAWIPPRLELPKGLLSTKVRASTSIESRDTVDADIWFSDGTRRDFVGKSAAPHAMGSDIDAALVRR